MDIIETATANTRGDKNAAVNKKTSWGKSLKMPSQFTIKEIDQHRQLSGKTPESAIIKTLDRGRKFKNERYITSDSIFTKCEKGLFYVKGLCKASMKKEKRSVAVKRSTISSKVLDGSCSCPAGKSGYCNHVMALLLELADYSLSQLNLFKFVPEEIACTSRLRQWGIPGESMQKAPVIETTVQKQPSAKGIISTLYDPRKVDDRAINWEKINLLKERLAERNNKTPFVTCLPPKCDGKKVNTRYGMFQIESPLSFHLNPVGFTTNIIANIPKLSMSPFTTHELPKYL